MSAPAIVSSTLLTQAIAWLRAGFAKAEVSEVRVYGGEFSAAEIPFTSYVCPSIMVTILGWTPGGNDRLGGKHVRTVRMAAFVAVKHSSRDKRMLQAMDLAERVSVRMRQWQPDCTGLPISIAPLDEDARCENLYSRALDKQGQALWLVDWDQAAKPELVQVQSYVLQAIQIDSDVSAHVPEPAQPSYPLVSIEHDIDFKT